MGILTKWVRASSGTTRVALMVAGVAVVGAKALIPATANPRVTPREIVLVAREMTLFLEGSELPNPTIAVRRGEEVRFVIRNQDAGITHGFAVSGVDAQSLDRIDAGTSAGITFRAPVKPGNYQYVCPPHAQMMKGTLLVTD